MTPSPPLARISMTIPADVLRRADRIAKREGRSRSWVLADAVRRLPEPTPASQPRLDESRRIQLAADLALSPTERVLAAERTAREVPVRRYGTLFVTFDRFEDYLEWKRREAVSVTR
jgi:predicted transcriptional regulator